MLGNIIAFIAIIANWLSLHRFAMEFCSFSKKLLLFVEVLDAIMTMAQNFAYSSIMVFQNTIDQFMKTLFAALKSRRPEYPITGRNKTISEANCGIGNGKAIGVRTESQGSQEAIEDCHPPSYEAAILPPSYDSIFPPPDYETATENSSFASILAPIDDRVSKAPSDLSKLSDASQLRGIKGSPFIYLFGDSLFQSEYVVRVLELGLDSQETVSDLNDGGTGPLSETRAREFEEPISQTVASNPTSREPSTSEGSNNQAPTASSSLTEVQQNPADGQTSGNLLQPMVSQEGCGDSFSEMASDFGSQSHVLGSVEADSADFRNTSENSQEDDASQNANAIQPLLSQSPNPDDVRMYRHEDNFHDLDEPADGDDMEENADLDETLEDSLDPLTVTKKMEGPDSFDNFYDYTPIYNQEIFPGSSGTFQIFAEENEGLTDDQSQIYATTVDYLPDYVTGVSPLSDTP